MTGERNPHVRDVPGVVALLALVGSHAYGTNRADSDEDYRGVFVVPTSDLFRLQKPMDTFDRQEPDITLHELAKFVKLAAAANPTVLEVLWCDPIAETADGALLRSYRHAFLSKRVMKTYGGYAQQQLRKAQSGTGGSRGRAHFRREKFVLHIYRLMTAGIYALEHGDLQVRVDDPDLLWQLACQPLDRVERDFARLDVDLQRAAAETDLAGEPDHALIDELLITIRRRHADVLKEESRV